MFELIVVLLSVCIMGLSFGLLYLTINFITSPPQYLGDCSSGSELTSDDFIRAKQDTKAMG